jgi:hypothetical protein
MSLRRSPRSGSIAVFVLLVAVTTTVAQPEFLFIGNSYTDANSLSTIFANIVNNGGFDNSEKSGGVWPYTESITTGGFDFSDHYSDFLDKDDGILSTELENEERNWKWVVLQDQSQIPGLYNQSPFDFSLSLDGAIGLNNAIRETGTAQTMFFMTWGRRDGDDANPDEFPDFMTMQRRLARGYKRFARATSTPQRRTYMAPVGIVFRTIYKQSTKNGDETLFSDLYAQDGSHPSLLGSYVAALTIYSSMTGIDPTIINYWPDGIMETTARDVQKAVKRTLARTARNGSITYPWKLPMTTRNRRHV